MKKILLTSSLLLSLNCLAGSGHDHSHGHSHGESHKEIMVSKEKTADLGKLQIKKMIKSGRINSSWADATYMDSQKKKFKKRTEWVVTFKNEKGLKGKILYIFLKLSGQYIAANFTGK